MKMLMEQSKAHEKMIREQKALFKEVIEKQQTALAQKKWEQKKMKAPYEENVERLRLDIGRFELLRRLVGKCGASKAGPCGLYSNMTGEEVRGEIEERGGAVGEDVWGRAVPEGLCRDVAIW
ncbi:uncharacterized protein MONOS_4403 [Monocercomonoides exilis]|uniref:uncharacterized protein n=1 Tax=Monocercomonoides exilis TaxID=2049356 RepID=UPI003559C0DB|nr:hypothetical protein MONOS_4403 [Monocercomonoides exilis]|eukprot:MONOS_4403.1-p1 / transcript=MONOS_4403.1 / gene=MONOS_4403 / organism=Monocercomonoides_exilis_PA203 / gene_product=unspecified product / transcript_product=unspecified product / location=Mono_scaffold00117:19669-20295(+) / protein_length=122 / sequence_SO=supercontig / SO=protein_coding / is_pseudo=false